MQRCHPFWCLTVDPIFIDRRAPKGMRTADFGEQSFGPIVRSHFGGSSSLSTCRSDLISAKDREPFGPRPARAN